MAANGLSPINDDNSMSGPGFQNPLSTRASGNSLRAQLIAGESSFSGPMVPSKISMAFPKNIAARTKGFGDSRTRSLATKPSTSVKAITAVPIIRKYQGDLSLFIGFAFVGAFALGASLGSLGHVAPVILCGVEMPRAWAASSWASTMRSMTPSSSSLQFLLRRSDRASKVLKAAQSSDLDLNKKLKRMTRCSCKRCCNSKQSDTSPDRSGVAASARCCAKVMKSCVAAFRHSERWNQHYLAPQLFLAAQFGPGFCCGQKCGSLRQAVD
jgi:hypothetical protein